MRAAYYGASALTGKGQAVGLFETIAYGIDNVNLTFSSAGQSYSVPINNVLLDGRTNTPIDGDVEPVLDIVQAIGMAPGLSEVRVYLGNSTADIFNAMAAENICKQLSVSYSWGPAVLSVDDPIFEEFAAQGQTVFAASGDQGAYSNEQPPSYPAESAYVTAVGATSLDTIGAGGSWNSETAWVQSGGGAGPLLDNVIISIPSWQEGIANSSNGGSTTLRDAPDVAMDGDFHNYTCQDGSCSGFWGGTSFSAPRWAGFMALINEQAGAQGKPSLGFINPAIYSIGRSPSYDREFHDITSGNNDCCGQLLWYNAVPGYDLVTGWGSPKGQNLINALAGGYTLSASLSSLTVNQGGSVTTTITVTDEGGFNGSVYLAVSGLPSGVTASFVKNSQTAGFLTFTASSFAEPGTTTVTITGTSGMLMATTAVLLVVQPSHVVKFAGSVQMPLANDGNGHFVATVKITNEGNVTVNSAQIGAAATTLGTVSPVSVSGPIMNLEVGASATVRLTFPMTSALSSASSAPLKINGTYSAGTLSGNWALTFRSVTLAH
jgi:subtilase family serine protease